MPSNSDVQIITVLSAPPEANRFESRAYFTQYTVSLCPSRKQLLNINKMLKESVKNIYVRPETFQNLNKISISGIIDKYSVTSSHNELYAIRSKANVINAENNKTKNKSLNEFDCATPSARIMTSLCSTKSRSVIFSDQTSTAFIMLFWLVSIFLWYQAILFMKSNLLILLVFWNSKIYNCKNFNLKFKFNILLP